MSYRWVEHTGEMELEIEASSEEEVFEQGLAALCELWDAEKGEPTDTRTLRLRASDRPALLAEWLSELAFLSEFERFVAQRVRELELGEGQLTAVVEGRSGRPPHLIKAVTYHRLTFERAGEAWRATAVLDV